MKFERIVNAAALAGKIMLEAGGETYRVEDTINRILTSYGVDLAESFVLPTGIIVSGQVEGRGISTLVRRVSSIQVDLEKISLVNDLSRQIVEDKLTVEQFMQELEIIMKRPHYPFWMVVFFAGFITFSFSIIFRGGLAEAAVAFAAGILVYLVRQLARSIHLNMFMQNAVGGMAAVFIAWAAFSLKFIESPSTVIIAAIMLLVPGITITNAIRDTFQGDYLSGVTRAMEAFVTAGGIAFGTGAAVFLMGVI